MKERFADLKERLSSDKKFKTRFISIVTACVVVVVLAVAIPVGIHNSKIDTQPVEAESTNDAEYEIALTTTPQAELTTEESTKAPTEAPKEAPTQTPVTTKSATKASTTKASTTKAVTTKAATTKAQNSGNNDYQKMIDAGVPESLAKNTHTSAADTISCWQADEALVNGPLLSPTCLYGCGRITGFGTYGTCITFTLDKNCPLCGQFVTANTCHTCPY